MSEQEQPQEEAFALTGDVASQMGAMLEFLAPDADPSEAPPTGPTGEVPDAQPGPGAGAAEADGAEAAPEGAPADGDGGVGADAPAGPDSGTAGGAVGDQPVSWTVDATGLTDTWGQLSTGFETSQEEYLQQLSLSEVQEEFKAYFDRLRVHPRTLVGQEVQSVSGPDKERLRDTEDAKQWQDAVKHLLAQEIEDRVATKVEELKPVYSTVHASIDLFRNNADLIPGTKQFDRELANEFAEMAKAYEQRADGKLIGYSVPVQPIINQIRSKLATKRAAPPPSTSVSGQPAQPRNEQGQWAPQGGITSKAGSSSDNSSDADGILSAFARQNGFFF